MNGNAARAAKRRSIGRLAAPAVRGCARAQETLGAADAKRRAVLAGGFGAAVLASTRVLAQASASLAPAKIIETLPFTVFDELVYEDKPDVGALGLTPVHIAYTWQLWGERHLTEGLAKEPPVDSLVTYAKRYRLDAKPPAIVILDVEHWKIYNTSEAAVQESIRKYLSLLETIRTGFPAMTAVGYYNIGPLPTGYGLAVRPYTAAELDAWRAQNDVIQPLVNKMDFLAPSLYTSAGWSRAGWERMAVAFIQEARRLAKGKRVIPFVWPQYFDTNPYEYMEGDRWLAQLNLVREHADSVVLWRAVGGAKGNSWDPKAPWWLATQQFLKTIR